MWNHFGPSARNSKNETFHIFSDGILLHYSYILHHMVFYFVFTIYYNTIMFINM